MYNAIYKCVFQRGKIISSFIAALLEVWLNFRTAPEVASSLPLKRHYINTHTYTHTHKEDHSFPKQPRGQMQIQSL